MPRPKTNGVQNRKTQIMQEAALQFRNHGYRATTMRRLAEQLNVEAASLYNHISCKEDLLQEICFSVAKDFHQHLAQTELDAGSPAKQLETIIRFHIDMMLHRHDDVYVSNRDWTHLKEPALSSYLNMRRDYEKRMMAMVQRGIACGELTEAQPRVVVLTLLSAVRAIEHWHRNPGRIAPSSLTENMVSLLMHGLKKR